MSSCISFIKHSHESCVYCFRWLKKKCCAALREHIWGGLDRRKSQCSATESLAVRKRPCGRAFRWEIKPVTCDSLDWFDLLRVWLSACCSQKSIHRLILLLEQEIVFLKWDAQNKSSSGQVSALPFVWKHLDNNEPNYMSQLLEYMSHFNNLRRKMALMAADPFTGAAAEGLLCGMAEPGWKSAAFPVNVELFAQNCSRVRILATSSRPPAQRGFRGPVRGGQVVQPAGLLGSSSLWCLCRPAPGRTDQREHLSLQRILLCARRAQGQGGLVEAVTGARERILDLCSFLQAQMWLISCLLTPGEMWQRFLLYYE